MKYDKHYVYQVDVDHNLAMRGSPIWEQMQKWLVGVQTGRVSMHSYSNKTTIVEFESRSQAELFVEYYRSYLNVV